MIISYSSTGTCQDFWVNYQNSCTCTNSDWLQAPVLLCSVSGVFIVVIYKNDKTWSYFDWKYITESGTENLRISLKIIEAYLLLCPNQFMHVCIQYSHYLWRLNTLVLLKIQYMYYKTYSSHNPYLNRHFYLQNFCNSLASSLHSLMSDIREEGQLLILRVCSDKNKVDTRIR